ncbi:MAG: PocR ligand-binding domain-containing protein [Spirochaetes bacterium]|nr:PocR ligand-binding domain-containing protein [Spirochaetota bacterium]MBU1080974.1 PocR ligand-binding domain-containing protein [Spirochaetota bacterium]
MPGKLGLFFDPEVQRLIDSFAYCFRVKITVFSPEMEELIVGLQNPGSRYCRIVQKGLQVRYRCCRQDKLMCERCARRRRLTIYRCHAGLSEAVLPLEIDGALIGYAMLGQFRTATVMPQDMLADWAKAKFDPAELTSAYMEQPYYDEAALGNILNLFSMMVSFIVSRDYVRVRRTHLVELVLAWLDEHMAEPADLVVVADAVNRCPSAVSHAVKRQLGISFKQLATLKKIQKFESLVARDPAESIQEAAQAVGFEDSLYFSRIYKKVRLSPPSTYARSVRDRAFQEERRWA